MAKLPLTSLSPFSWRRKPPAPPPDDIDLNIPLGVNPMIDYVRFSLSLMRHQAELADLVMQLAIRYQQMRNGVLTLSILAFIASVCQLVQIWTHWR